jgi:hypothetical protein
MVLKPILLKVKENQTIFCILSCCYNHEKTTTCTMLVAGIKTLILVLCIYNKP